MTAPVTLPGGRVLLGWWRELAMLPVLRLWFGPLLLHRVEALTCQSWPVALGVLERALLEGCANPDQAGPLLQEPAILYEALRQLTHAGLLEGEPTSLRCTSRGREALSEGRYTVRETARRVFHFAETETGEPPYFLPLVRPLTAPIEPPEGWRFDPALLTTAVAESAEWKEARQFPAEVEAVRQPGAEADSDEWRAVVLDRAEVLPLLVVQLAGGPGEPHLLGLPVTVEGWVLHPSSPVLTLGPGWEEAVGPLVPALTAEDAMASWSAWCQGARMPAGEVAECEVMVEGHRLLVKAPGKLVDRLRVARSELFKGEGWLLAGPGRMKAALRIELVG